MDFKNTTTQWGCAIVTITMSWKKTLPVILEAFQFPAPNPNSSHPQIITILTCFSL